MFQFCGRCHRKSIGINLLYISLCVFLLIYRYVSEVPIGDEPVDLVLGIHETRAHTAAVFRLHRYTLPGHCALLAKGLDPRRREHRELFTQLLLRQPFLLVDLVQFCHRPLHLGDYLST